jgi:hypothetical protein
LATGASILVPLSDTAMRIPHRPGNHLVGIYASSLMLDVAGRSSEKGADLAAK